MQKAPSFFIAFEKSIVEGYTLPDRFTLTHGNTPHPLSALAAQQLQAYLDTQAEWSHNFGLSHDEAPVVGKMFGVLVVEFENRIGYLAAFSGKLAGGNHHSGFVPPVFDTLAENGFLHRGMSEISRMNKEIKAMHPLEHKEQILALKILRRNYSVSLQQEIFDHYHFLNRAGEFKSANDLFSKAGYRNPPAGAGECAAPKLLQYAFQHHLKPLALAEFWWGLSPKSESWKHGHFYPCCREKCAPIMAHMLSGIDD